MTVHARAHAASCDPRPPRTQDFIPASGGFPDPYTNMTEDMGITPAIQRQLAADYTKNMAAVYDEVLSRGMFSWQQLWNGQSSPTDKNGCCTEPLVKPATCAAALRNLCKSTSPAQTRYMKYAFSPGGCSGDPGKLTYPLQGAATCCAGGGRGCAQVASQASSH